MIEYYHTTIEQFRDEAFEQVERKFTCKPRIDTGQLLFHLCEQQLKWFVYPLSENVISKEFVVGAVRGDETEILFRLVRYRDSVPLISHNFIGADINILFDNL